MGKINNYLIKKFLENTLLNVQLLSHLFVSFAVCNLLQADNLYRYVYKVGRYLPK